MGKRLGGTGGCCGVTGWKPGKAGRGLSKQYNIEVWKAGRVGSGSGTSLGGKGKAGGMAKLSKSWMSDPLLKDKSCTD